MSLSRSLTCVVLWAGEYKNDGLERLRWLNSAANRVTNAYLVGEPGDWQLVAEAQSHDPKAA